MRKKIKLFCYVIIVFFIAMFFNYKTSAMEVTTEVKGKFSFKTSKLEKEGYKIYSNHECLKQYGGKITYIEGGSESRTGGGYDSSRSPSQDGANSQNQVLVDYTLYASNDDDITYAGVCIDSANNDAVCCEKINFNGGKVNYFPYSNGTFGNSFFDTSSNFGNVKIQIIFGGKNNDFRYEGSFNVFPFWEDTEGKGKVYRYTGDKSATGHYIIYLDNTGPKISNFKIEEQDNKIVSSLTWDTGSKKGINNSKREKGGSYLMIQGLNSEGKEICSSDNFEHGKDKNMSIEMEKCGDDVALYVATYEVIDSGGNSSANSARLDILENDVAVDTNEKIEYGEQTVSSDSVKNTSTGAALPSDFGDLGNNDYKFTCDDDITNFIDKLWNMVLVAGPVLMLVMSTIEFVKALLASDADALSKAGSNTVKRAIAFVGLLLLKVILSTILNLFNIGICW